MALPGLVRVATVARLLGAKSSTTAAWCRRLGIPLATAPVRGIRKQKGGPGPLYVSVEQAATLLDQMLPGVANLAERRAMYVRLRRRAKKERAASRNITNEVIWER